MLYSEFLAETGAPETMTTFTVYQGLNRIYMRHDEYKKEEVYRDGARILEDLEQVSRPRRIVPKNAYYHGLNKPFTYSCSHCLYNADEDDCFCRMCGAEFLSKEGSATNDIA